jgi:hypothetical protein
VLFQVVENTYVLRTVMAEVSGPSPVVPVILSKRVKRILQEPLRAQKGPASRPFCAPFFCVVTDETTAVETFLQERSTEFDARFSRCYGLLHFVACRILMDEALAVRRRRLID